MFLKDKRLNHRSSLVSVDLAKCISRNNDSINDDSFFLFSAMIQYSFRIFYIIFQFGILSLSLSLFQPYHFQPRIVLRTGML